MYYLYTTIEIVFAPNHFHNVPLINKRTFLLANKNRLKLKEKQPTKPTHKTKVAPPAQSYLFAQSHCALELQ